MKDERDNSSLMETIVSSLRGVFDPEIPVNIYDLGLIYTIDVDDEASTVRVEMTLTSPACPVAGTLPGEVERAVRAVCGEMSVDVSLVWDPPWTIDRIPEEVQLELGIL